MPVFWRRSPLASIWRSVVQLTCGLRAGSAKEGLWEIALRCHARSASSIVARSLGETGMEEGFVVDAER